MKSARTIIESMPIDRANLGYIAKTGKINGSLLVTLERAFKEYAGQAIDKCAKEAKTESVGAFPSETIVNIQSILKVKTELK